MPQLDSAKATIGGKSFEIFKLDPLTSLRALNIVKDVLAPALGAAVGSIQSIGDVAKMLDSEEGSAGLGVAIEKLLTMATYDRQVAIIDTFKAVTQVDGKKLEGEFDLLFRGDLPLLYKWLELCFKGEWGNLAGAIKDAIADQIAQADSKQTSRATSSSPGQSITSAPSGDEPASGT
jgi:hypothetical protein